MLSVLSKLFNMAELWGLRLDGTNTDHSRPISGAAFFDRTAIRPPCSIFGG